MVILIMILNGLQVSYYIILLYYGHIKKSHHAINQACKGYQSQTNRVPIHQKLYIHIHDFFPHSEQESPEEHTTEMCPPSSAGTTSSRCTTKYPQTCRWTVQQSFTT